MGRPKSASLNLLDLLNDYMDATPELGIWRRWPDVSEAEVDATDAWECEQVSRDFAEFARMRGWTVDVPKVEGREPLTGRHVWCQVLDAPGWIAVDWTARQFHNLRQPTRDPAVLDAPWPLLWNPALWPREHPLMGEWTRVG